MGIVFPTVAHFGCCACTSPCHTETCRNVRVNVYCNINGCPYDVVIVTAKDIGAGEVLGQYLGDMDLVRPSVRDRPRNRGYRLVMKMRPESPAYPVRVVINAEFMGGIMRFVNHSYNPVAEFREVSNGRRTTVVMATTAFIRKGREITVDYGDNLWFVCRCGDELCRHRNIQNEEDS
uniref:SET domain-containing protein n=1 Tax=Phytophthora ramorum TaxID=164328 RepID=H3H9A8_PHYRM